MPPIWLPFYPSSPHLGLDIGPHHLRLAAVQMRGHSSKRGQRALQVVALAEQRFDAAICRHGQLGDLQQITQACTDLLCRHGLTRATHTSRRSIVHMALPAQAVPQWRLTLPASSAAHARMAQARVDCRLRLGSAADDAVLDYCRFGPDSNPAPGAPDELPLLLACSRSLLVEDRQALATALHLRGGMIGLQEQLSAALLRRHPAHADAAILHLAQDSAWLMHGQSLHLLAWHPAHPLHALLLELAPHLHLQPPPARLLLTGELAHLPGLVPALLRYAGIPAGIGRLPVTLPTPPVANLPAFHTALALASAQLA